MTEGQVCTRCVLDSGVPGIRFDENGVCNYCHMHDRLARKYELNETNKRRFEKLLAKIRASGQGKKYDCIVGVSGGRDSTYCLYRAKELGLRPLAVCVDNGWHASVAQENVRKVVEKLNVDLRTVKNDWEELKPMYRAFLKASVPSVCGPCFVGTISHLYKIAVEEGVKYVILGASFRTEGIVPLKWNYIDGKYFDRIVKRFAGIDTGDFNKTRISNLLDYALIKKIKVIQLPLYVEYNNERIGQVLTEKFDWVDGGGHHFDCTYKPMALHVRNKKFDVDPRKVSYSALVRSKEMTRESALRKLEEEAIGEDWEGIDHCLEQLGMTKQDLAETMSSEPRDFVDYPTYYSMLRSLKTPIKWLCRMRLIPETVYEKYFET
jgi:N-acetyl sugar amidotransferase